MRLSSVERYSFQDYISFKSRELKYKQLWDTLTDVNNYMTGLRGIGGTGKTTMAIKIAKDLKQSKHFDQVIVTTVSFTPAVKEIQDEIVGSLGLSLQDYIESDWPGVLWSRLTNGEKILLILDDVWGHIDFGDIGIPCSNDCKDCRVFLTTRNLWVCNRMGCGRTIQLELLYEEDSWTMFKRRVTISDSSPKSLLIRDVKLQKNAKGCQLQLQLSLVV